MTANSARSGAHKLRSLLIAVLAVLLAILIGTYFWLPAFLKVGGASGRIETLRAQAPAATLSPIATTLAGADFDLLNDPAGEVIARDLDLYSWYAAGADPAAANASVPSALPESATPETTVPDADAPGCAGVASGCAGTPEESSDAPH